MWLYGSSLIIVREAQRRSNLHLSPLWFMFRVLGKWSSHRHNPGWVGTSLSWCSKNDINCAQRGSRRSISLEFRSSLAPLPIGMIQELFQPSFLDQLIQIIPPSSTILSGVSTVLVVLAVKTLVVPHGFSSHLVWPFEVCLILDLLQDLMYWFSEHRVNYVRSHRPRLPSKIPMGSVIAVTVRPKILPLLKDNLSLSLPLLLVFLNPLVFVNMIHKPTHTPYQLLGQGLS